MVGGQRTCRHVHRHFVSSTFYFIFFRTDYHFPPEGSSLAHNYCMTFELAHIKGHAIIACKEGAWE